jgi:hypothetical protein
MIIGGLPEHFIAYPSAISMGFGMTEGVGGQTLGFVSRSIVI